MPTYAYACRDCGHRFDRYQSFSEDALVTCPECGHDALRKVFASVGISFRGSGFYSTDSRSAAASSRPSAPAEDAASAPSASGSGSGAAAGSSSSSSGAARTD